MKDGSGGCGFIIETQTGGLYQKDFAFRDWSLHPLWRAGANSVMHLMVHITESMFTSQLVQTAVILSDFQDYKVVG